MLQYLEDFYFAGSGVHWSQLQKMTPYTTKYQLLCRRCHSIKNITVKKRKKGLYSRHTSGVIPPIFLNKKSNFLGSVIVGGTRKADRVILCT